MTKLERGWRRSCVLLARINETVGNNRAGDEPSGIVTLVGKVTNSFLDEYEHD